MKQEREVTNWEQSFFRIYWLVILFQYGIVGLSLAFSNQLRDVGKQLGDILVWLLLAPFFAFVIALYRLLAYLFSWRKKVPKPRIWRSLVVFLTSPIAFFFYYIFLFALLLSLSSCTIH
jgi:hypothetical protein